MFIHKAEIQYKYFVLPYSIDVDDFFSKYIITCVLQNHDIIIIMIFWNSSENISANKKPNTT